jgi:hypothetical protein
MNKFIIAEILKIECFNDPKLDIFQDNNGDPVEFNTMQEAKEYGIIARIPKFVIYQQVSEEIEMPYDPNYDD